MHTHIHIEPHAHMCIYAHMHAVMVMYSNSDAKRKFLTSAKKSCIASWNFTTRLSMSVLRATSHLPAILYSSEHRHSKHLEQASSTCNHHQQQDFEDITYKARSPTVFNNKQLHGRFVLGSITLQPEPSLIATNPTGPNEMWELWESNLIFQEFHARGNSTKPSVQLLAQQLQGAGHYRPSTQHSQRNGRGKGELKKIPATCESGSPENSSHNCRETVHIVAMIYPER